MCIQTQLNFSQVKIPHCIQVSHQILALFFLPFTPTLLKRMLNTCHFHFFTFPSHLTFSFHNFHVIKMRWPRSSVTSMLLNPMYSLQTSELTSHHLPLTLLSSLSFSKLSLSLVCVYHIFLATPSPFPFNQLLNIRVLERQAWTLLLFLILTLFLGELASHHGLIIMYMSVASNWSSLLNSKYIYCLRGIASELYLNLNSSFSFPKSASPSLFPILVDGPHDLPNCWRQKPEGQHVMTMSSSIKPSCEPEKMR